MSAARQESELEQCVRCVMDDSDPDLDLDETGVCRYCRAFPTVWASLPHTAEAQRVAVESLVAGIRGRQRGGDYDCVLGLSGGADSSFLALKVKEWGLRPLAVHFDTGWNSELSVANISALVEHLELDLVTKVCDWDEMRDLQLAFFRAGVANCDIPQDHAFLAVLLRTAAEHGIRTILSGHNIATEFVLPAAWGYTSRDPVHLRAIHRRFGTHRLRNYPILGLFDDRIRYPWMQGIVTLKPLNLVDYDKERAKAELREIGWRDYGGKHHESRFTRFFQAYYLPKKFGFDKRKAHLSSLILSGQSTKEAALAELALPAMSLKDAERELEFLASKLGVSAGEFRALIEQPPVAHEDYPNAAWLYALPGRIRRLLRA